MDVTFSDGVNGFTIVVPGSIKAAPNGSCGRKVSMGDQTCLPNMWNHQPVPCNFGDSLLTRGMEWFSSMHTSVDAAVGGGVGQVIPAGGGDGGDAGDGGK